MLQDAFIKHLEEVCSQIENKPVKLRAYETIYGGDINQAYRLAMTERDYFIKINRAEYADMFDKEAKSLNLLQQAEAFIIPKVFKTDVFENQAFLLMEYITPLENTENPKNFAENLAKMHHRTNDTFGLDFDNYIGTLTQQNNPQTNWVDFYVNQRLKAQINLSNNKLPVDILKKFDKLFDKLPQLLPQDPPALLHGDLWNGNAFYDLQGQAVLVDPAVYYGHREVDLAMMSLFGGFSREIYDIYNHLFPLEPDWQNRLKIYQLYPLLVHFNLFGDTYLSPINQILNFFVKNN
jgi:protein-ribulosamine 3-kinase